MQSRRRHLGGSGTTGTVMLRRLRVHALLLLPLPAREMSYDETLCNSVRHACVATSCLVSHRILQKGGGYKEQ